MTILGAWLLADFATGLVHWWQDRVLVYESRFSFINSIKGFNDLHHLKPAAMLNISSWQNIKESVWIAWPMALALWLAGVPTFFWLAVLFMSFGNLVHRWAHLPKGKVKQPIRFMQATGLFISHEHHRRHHMDFYGLIKKENSRMRFCPMTNWLNPVLDEIQFFSLLEKIFLVPK